MKLRLPSVNPNLPRFVRSLKIKAPSGPTMAAALVITFIVSTTAAVTSTAVLEVQRGERRATLQREVNGNQAMIFAVCRALNRRDTFELQRLNGAVTRELRYQSMTKPFSPIVKNYFRERRKDAMHNALVEKQKFVDFNCIKGMEKAYFDGYNSPSTLGRPSRAPPKPRPSSRSTVHPAEPRTREAFSFGASR